ncbi:hypothetical protein KBX19_01605 [Corynebacterium sp. CCUG 71335]|uniref:hypothetical protein n=1 Tax=Corynebacterium sp. CCUG 71335 TaxID=2823892 RepID=UPI0021086EC8|nr:hypothetical protein [Corynebacterium sp. CCUG 71335]MCQ4619017.1 hypothetical protein [Corynebacterium pseudogenitalium]MCQ4619922.1 hypothetical protein [Corynebacterium sp. CCUG 71335]
MLKRIADEWSTSECDEDHYEDKDRRVGARRVRNNLKAPDGNHRYDYGDHANAACALMDIGCQFKAGGSGGVDKQNALA